MMNYGPLPDLLALTVLVYVFWSMLRRRAGNQLSAWLLGWIFILVHFAAQLFTGRPGIIQNTAVTISLTTLALAGAAFIYAAGRGSSTPRFRWIVSIGLCAVLLYILFDGVNLQAPAWYFAAAALLFASGIAALFPDEGRPATDRNLYVLFAFALAGALVLLSQSGLQDYGLDCIFFVIYMLAGIQYWRKFPRRTTGSWTAVVGLAAWASVFPIAAMLDRFKPHLVVGESVWNIPKYIVAIGMLLTLLEEQIGRTEHLALHDPLTGLPNRRLLEDRLTKAIERAERNEVRVAVLLIDLDGFKQINDTYGHAVGDEVLRVVATRLQIRVRKADTIARAGGDEFLVVVSDLLQAHGARVLANKLMADLNEPILLGDVRLRPCASIGVAIYPDDAQTAESLCSMADSSMYEQKRRVKTAP